MMKKPINKRFIYKPLKCEFWTYKGEKCDQTYFKNIKSHNKTIKPNDCPKTPFLRNCCNFDELMNSIMLLICGRRARRRDTFFFPN